MKSHFPKQDPVIKSYRDYKNFNQAICRNEFLKELYNVHKGKVDYNTFEQIVVRLLNIYAPIKEKYFRANNAPFMNKKLSKAVMNRSRYGRDILKLPRLIIKPTILSIVTTVLDSLRERRDLIIAIWISIL